MKNLTEIDLNNKKILIRADLNVPIDDDLKITDDNRIKQFLPTLNYILQEGGMPIVMSHFGRPAGKRESKHSLAPVAKKLQELSGKEVIFATDCIGAEVKKLSDELEPNKVLLLENLRFHAAEKDNNPKFAQELASLGQVYVNDAFATAHRAHASIVGVPNFIKVKAPGLLMQRELDFYKKTLIEPKRPLCIILGGAKVSTKFQALSHLAGLADKIIIGGAMANTFLAAQGFQMGRSLYEANLFPKVLELMGSLARRGCQLYLPVDFVVAPSLNSTGLGRPVTAQDVPADSMALDIGPATSILYREALQSAETIVWNGPMGAFEKEDFSKGTTDLIEHLASAHGLTVAGGGDTDSAIHEMELAHKFDFISTGGGAFLALLEGSDLPAVTALNS